MAAILNWTIIKQDYHTNGLSDLLNEKQANTLLPLSQASAFFLLNYCFYKSSERKSIWLLFNFHFTHKG